MPSDERRELVTALEMERRLVDALEKANNELRRTNRLKDEFISNVSHELRTSLAAVKNVISNAIAGVFGELAENFRRSLLIADDNIRRFGHIINDLLDIARLGSGKMSLHRMLTDPVQAIMNVVTSFEEEAARRGIALRGRWEAPEMFVFMDQDRIAQVISNLISNALKFTPHGGHVDVRGTILDANRKELPFEHLKSLSDIAELAIEVSDTGPGIDPRLRDIIFDRFEQAHAAAHAETKGLGLGLSICKQLVTLHGGRIWAGKSSKGGALFTFTLPVLGKERMFRESLSDRLAAAVMHHYPVALVLLEFGGQAGPECADMISEEMAGQIETIIIKTLRRKGDTVMWRGGGRFGIMLPHTSSEEAERVVVRIREAIADGFKKSGEAGQGLAVSSGVSSFPEDLDSVDPLISAAEERLRKR